MRGKACNARGASATSRFRSAARCRDQARRALPAEGVVDRAAHRIQQQRLAQHHRARPQQGQQPVDVGIAGEDDHRQPRVQAPQFYRPARRRSCPLMPKSATATMSGAEVTANQRLGARRSDGHAVAAGFGQQGAEGFAHMAIVVDDRTRAFTRAGVGSQGAGVPMPSAAPPPLSTSRSHSVTVVPWPGARDARGAAGTQREAAHCCSQVGALRPPCGEEGFERARRHVRRHAGPSSSRVSTR